MDEEHTPSTNENKVAPVKMKRVRQRGIILPGYLRKADAAFYLGVSLRTLTNMMQRRMVAYSKMSHGVCLFRIVDLDKATARFRVNALIED